jgi:hypothetical protein
MVVTSGARTCPRWIARRFSSTSRLTDSGEFNEPVEVASLFIPSGAWLTQELVAEALAVAFGAPLAPFTPPKAWPKPPALPAAVALAYSGPLKL